MARRVFPGRPSHKCKHEIFRYRYQEGYISVSNKSTRNLERNFQQFYKIFGASDDDDEFEGFPARKCRRIDSSKYTSKSKINHVRKSNYMCAPRIRQNDSSLCSKGGLSRNKVRMNSVPINDRMIKNGQKGIYKPVVAPDTAIWRKSDSIGKNKCVENLLPSNKHVKSRIIKPINKPKNKVCTNQSFSTFKNEKSNREKSKSKTEKKGERFFSKGSAYNASLRTAESLKSNGKHSVKQILNKTKAEKERGKKEKEPHLKNILKKKYAQKQDICVKQFLQRKNVLGENIQRQKENSAKDFGSIKIERTKKQEKRYSIGKHRLLNSISLNQKGKKLPKVIPISRRNSSFESNCSSYKDNVHRTATIVKRRRSFTLPSESMRSSRKIIPQKRYRDEYELQSILFKKIKQADDNSKNGCEKHFASSIRKPASAQTKPKSCHKTTTRLTQRQKYMQWHKFYKWVPFIPSSSDDNSLVVEGKRQWKPSPKFQTGFAKHRSLGLSRFSLTLKNVKRKYTTTAQKCENRTSRNRKSHQQNILKAREHFAFLKARKSNIQKETGCCFSGRGQITESSQDTTNVNNEITDQLTKIAHCMSANSKGSEMKELKKRTGNSAHLLALQKEKSKNLQNPKILQKTGSVVSMNSQDTEMFVSLGSEQDAEILQDIPTKTVSDINRHIFQNSPSAEISQDISTERNNIAHENTNVESLQTLIERNIITKNMENSKTLQHNAINYPAYEKELDKAVKNADCSLIDNVKKNTAKQIWEAIKTKKDKGNVISKSKSQPCIKYTRRIKFSFVSRKQHGQFNQNHIKEIKHEVDNNTVGENFSDNFTTRAQQEELKTKKILVFEKNQHSKQNCKEIHYEEMNEEIKKSVEVDDLKQLDVMEDKENLKIDQAKDENCASDLNEVTSVHKDIETQSEEIDNNQVDSQTEKLESVDSSEAQDVSKVNESKECEDSQQLNQDSSVEIQSSETSVLEKKTFEQLDSSEQKDEGRKEKTPGTVSCTICGQSKFRMHVKRHYGQFCCPTCSKFFASFLRRPEQYYCPEKGCCPLIPECSSEAGAECCKACWLKTCLDKFVVPVYTRKKIKNYIPKLLEEKSEELPDSKETSCDNTILIFQETIENHKQNLLNSFQSLPETTENNQKNNNLEEKDANEESSVNGDLSMLIDLDDCLFSDVEYVCNSTNDNDATTSESEVMSGKFRHNLRDRSNGFFPQEDAASSSTLSADEDNEFDRNENEITYRKNSEKISDDDNFSDERRHEISLKFYRSRKRNLNLSSQKTTKDESSSEKSSKPAVKRFSHRVDENRKTFKASTADSTKKTKHVKQAGWSPRIKHVCRRASVVFGRPVAKFEKLIESDDFNLSALPREEKERILEHKTGSPDLDDLPLDELIRRASEKDGRDIIITPRVEKKDITYFTRSRVNRLKKPQFSYIRNRLKKSQPKRQISYHVRKIRCKTCAGCLTEECGKCNNCLDKPKNGGPNLLRKACVNRRCLRPQISLNSNPGTAVHRRKYFYKTKRHSEMKDGQELYTNNDDDNIDKTDEKPLSGQASTTEINVNSNENNVSSLSKNWKNQRREDRRYLKPHFIFADYWEEYDQDRIWNDGFPLISSELLEVRIVCFLCGSAGLHDFIYCNLCCEPFHSFCVEDATFGKPVYQETWACFRCQNCTVCGQKDDLLKCKLCTKLYHADCSGPDYPTTPSKNNTWICSSCIKCGSCSSVSYSEEGLCEWDFDNPFCERCTYCMKKGNFCPICHQCYDDDDYESKMVQCSKCQLWVHATCDNITDEQYDILSYLPESVVYICSSCTEEESRSWLDAVHEELIKGQKQILLALINNDPLNIEDRYQLKTEEELQIAREQRKSRDLSLERQNIETKFTHHLLEFERNKTTCTLTLFLRKVENEEYTTLYNFYEEIASSLNVHMLPVTHNKLLEKFTKVIKQYFPWFTYIRPKIKKSQPSPDLDLSNCIVALPYLDHSYARCNFEPPKAEEPPSVQPGKLRDSSKEDQRKCVLCGQFGDDIRTECGRLIYCGQNDWAHVNCALWSAEVFEEVDGSLQNVHPAISRGKSMPCEHCGRKGATIGCCIRGCPANYHFKCAQEAYAVFQDDKKLYCANHKDKVDDKAIANEAFFVKHCMYVDQEGMSPKWLRKTWQNGLPAGCVHVTIGSLTVESLGHLTTASDHPDILVPVDFIATRLFWSTKNPEQRVIYTIRTIEVKPMKETEEVNISEHHTVAHSVEKSLLNKHHKRNRKITTYWNHKIPQDNEQICFSPQNKLRSSISENSREQILNNVTSNSILAAENTNADQSVLKASEKCPLITKVIAESNQEINNDNFKHDSAHLTKIFNGSYNKLNGLKNYANIIHKAAKSMDLGHVSNNEAVTTDLPENFNKNRITVQYPKKCIDNTIKDKEPINTILHVEENICSNSTEAIKNVVLDILPKEKENISDVICNSKSVPSKKLNCELQDLNDNSQIHTTKECVKNQIIKKLDLATNSEEVENIYPQRLEKKQGLRKILKTYPLRSHRYQESIKFLKYSNEGSSITVNTEQKEKQQKTADRLIPSDNADKMCHIRPNSHSLNNNKIDNDSPRQLRRTRARSYFDHMVKHKLLYKKNQALNNLISGKMSNCKIRIDHNSNSEIIEEKNSLYETSFDFAIQKTGNINNFTSNEIVVAVGEIEKFNDSLENTKIEAKRRRKLNHCRNNTLQEKTFKCKICKRQYRTRDSCEKHEQSCTFIVDSSSTDEDEFELLQNIENRKSDKENEASSSSYNSEISVVNLSSGDNSNTEHISVTNCNTSILTDQSEEMLNNSVESVHPANLSSSNPNHHASDDLNDNTQSAIGSISEESTLSSSSIIKTCYNNSKNENRNLSQAFILPKLPNSDLNTANSYNSFPPNNRMSIPENSMTINNINMPMIVEGNVHTFRTCETVQTVNGHFVIPQQAETLNVNHPICIQNTCQFVSTGVNIIQNPHLSYLGSITISNQESLSLAFNLHDSSFQLPSNIIMDQIQSTSQVTSNIPVPLLNYPIINTPPQNTQTYLPQPTVLHPQQVMYLNPPMFAQTQVSESVLIVNSEPPPPTILYEMPANVVTSSSLPTSLCDTRNNFNGNVPEQLLTDCVSVRTGAEGNALASAVKSNYQSILKPLSSTHINNIDNKPIHSSATEENSKVCAIKTMESTEQCATKMHSLNHLLVDNNIEKSNATETSSLKATKNSRHSSGVTELKNLTSNKALIDALKKAAQQMLQLKLKNCQMPVNSEVMQNKSDKTLSGAKNRSKCREQRIKHKATKLRRNSTSSMSDSSAADLSLDNVDSIQLLEQLQVQDSKCHSEDKDKPYIMYEISSSDGLYLKSSDINEAWKVVVDEVQEACMKANLKRKNIRHNGADGVSMMGLTNNAVRYLLEQLPGSENCLRYAFRFHPPLTEEKLPINPSGCARSEPFQSRKDYDMFNFLLSKHRSPPEYQPLIRDDEMKHKSSRRATSIELPMAMRFRHLKNSAKEAVGVYRSQIHGRGLFCKRTIEAGEMVIEYAGEVIRSILTDTREIYYESKGIGCYMFRIDDNEVVDATMHGNAARFINHSCEPNCYSKVINVDGKKHIVIFAMKRIVKGEELTYNYKFPIEDEKIPCTCGTKRCRKYLN